MSSSVGMVAFQGFEPANTTPVPDVFFDELLALLREAELKALLYIIRRTAGFKKTSDAISLSQFQRGIVTKEGKVLDHGCGVKDRRSLTRALESLENDWKCIKSFKSKSDSGDDNVTLYCLNFREVVVQSDPPQAKGSGANPPPTSRQNPPPVVGQTHQGSGANPPGVVGKTHPQETVIQLDSLQETVIQETTDAAASQPQQPAHSQKKGSHKEPEPPTQPELPHVDEPDLSALSELEQTIYHTLLREQDKKPYLAWRPTQRNIYVNWLGVFGYTVPVNITAAIIRDVDRFESIQPSTQDFLDVRKYAFEQEKEKPENKRYYKKRGFKFWDAVSEWANWKSQRDMAMETQTQNAPATSQTEANDAMTHDEACQLALDAVELAKAHGYDIQTKSFLSKRDGRWHVRIFWGEGKFTVHSPAHWKSEFKDISATYEIEHQEEAK